MKNSKKNKLLLRVLVTAGPTIEPLDPIRFITNHSTGVMGYEIAAEGVKKGFEICLVSGPVKLSAPRNVHMVNVLTAKEMDRAVRRRIKDFDCLIMTAAVCDFRPEKKKKNKIKKKDSLEIRLMKNPDILSSIKSNNNLIKVGFALETKELLKNGQKKLKDKNLDFIVGNIKKRDKNPFGEGKKDYTMISAAGKIEAFKNVSKRKMAKVILRAVENIARRANGI